MAKRKRLLVHVIPTTYEDYTTEYNGTVQQLFDFFGSFSVVPEPFRFVPGKACTDVNDREGGPDSRSFGSCVDNARR
jgi:hypothetical protein